MRASALLERINSVRARREFNGAPLVGVACVHTCGCIVPLVDPLRTSERLDGSFRGSSAAGGYSSHGCSASHKGVVTCMAVLTPLLPSPHSRPC
jgi:hypothetical protein